MKAKEVSIGNKVDLYGKVATIQRFDFNDRPPNGLAIDKGKPIPLTEDWLKNWYLEKRTVTKGLYPWSEYSIRNGFDIYCYIDMVGNCLIYGKCIEGEDFFIIKCDKVHEFQNIYKILTGKELKQNNEKA